jgi:murein DD-endopeptidase MepM/ murein hydrolase activator NlpD
MSSRYTSLILVPLLLVGPSRPSKASLEVRFSPGDFIYLAQENRELGLGSIQLQNVAIVNSGPNTVAIGEVEIELRLGDQAVLVERHSGEALDVRWARLKTRLGEADARVAQDPRFRFRELLGDSIRLGAAVKLEPRSAFYLPRRFFYVDPRLHVTREGARPIWPDRVRVTAHAVSTDGTVTSAVGELRIVRYEPPNNYTLPLRGRWYVASSASVRSHHRSQPAHEFALDLTRIREGGSYRGAGRTHADYYAFGQHVHAIGDGTVVAVYDVVPDTRLRRADETVEEYRQAVLVPMSAPAAPRHLAGGNQIVIQHAGGEFSTYAHLRHGSIRVATGDRVVRGQAIAEVGMSGDGYEPHLHVQLTNGPDLYYSRGIPLIFGDAKPVRFSSTIDSEGRRQLQTGEFIQSY